MIRHLRWKVVATNMLLTSLVLLAVFAAVVLISRDNYRKSVQQQLYQALESGDYGSRQPGAEGIPCFVAEVLPSGTVRVSGSNYYDLQDEDTLLPLVTAALSADADSGVLPAQHMRYFRLEGALTVRIAFMDSTFEQATLRSLVRVCLLIGAAALLVLFGLSWLLSGFVTRPVARTWQNQQQFLSDASHELKTPLQGIIGSAELIENGLVKQEDLPRFVGHIRREAQRLVALIGDIIRLSQLDEGDPLPWERVDVSALCRDIAADLRDKSEKSGTAITVEGPEIPVEGVRRLLYETVYNLCDNAIQYNVPGGSVRVTVTDRGDSAAISVADTGIGIAPEHQSRVFERFYRVDKSHSKASGGTGLGLSIVKHAVAYHHGTLDLESQPGKGTTITVTIPKKKP